MNKLLVQCRAEWVIACQKEGHEAVREVENLPRGVLRAVALGPRRCRCRLVAHDENVPLAMSVALPRLSASSRTLTRGPEGSTGATPRSSVSTLPSGVKVV